MQSRHGEKMYDQLSNDYDRFVNWKNRLAMELPFIKETITKSLPDAKKPIRVLDAAAGTGMHAIALGKMGFDVSGSDLSAGMIHRARENADTNKVNVRFEIAGFGQMEKSFGKESMNAVLCLGNSLPHVTKREELLTTLLDFSNCLRRDGILILQNRNFDAVMASRERWMEPQFYREKSKEWLFLRFYDYLPDGLINFNIITLVRNGYADWKQSISETTLMPLLSFNMKNALLETGFDEIVFYGDMNGSIYNPSTSGNLVVTARKKKP
jgi:glycine/sarcosine N-methyltransferase